MRDLPYKERCQYYSRDCERCLLSPCCSDCILRALISMKSVAPLAVWQNIQKALASQATPLKEEAS